MRKLLDLGKKLLPKQENTEIGEEYVELEADIDDKKAGAKVLIRPFTLKDFENIKPILNSLREGYTIALINIAPLKEKDISDLKRAIDKLKKTIEATDGDIAGFGENWIIATPSFAKVFKGGVDLNTEEEVDEALDLE